MKVVFYASEGHDLDRGLAEAFQTGCARHGVSCETRWMKTYVDQVDADLAVLVGVKGRSKLCFETHRRAGKHALIFDKGYVRVAGGPYGTLYWRSSLDAFQPHAYFQAFCRPADRWQALDRDLAFTYPRGGGRSILFCGSSQKYCNWHALGDATEYAQGVLRQLAALTDRPLVYRPKPSWKDAVPIAGARFSSGKERFEEALQDVFALVTFGSNAAFEALLRGVSVIVLGDGIARPLASTELAAIASPRLALWHEVRQLACDVAYCQWSVAQIAAGEAWPYFAQAIDYLEDKKA